MARAVIDLNDEPPEAATTLKVIRNSIIFNMADAVAEGHVLAEKTGLGVSQLHRYLSLFFPGVYTHYSTRMITGDYWNRNEAYTLNFSLPRCSQCY
jgi:3-hydroxyisobutyrate dehydrogenase-like beta-hydroxyacid dehydrogenase